MSVLKLADAKTFLSIENTITDTELQLFLDAAEASIVTKCGPLVPTVTTRRVRGNGKPALLLPVTPVLTLTSVTPVNGVALDVTKLFAEWGGTVEYLTGGTFASPFYDVVYTAGRTTTPTDLMHAVREHTKQLWKSYQSSTRGAKPEMIFEGAFSPKVKALIAQHLQAGIA